MFRDLDSPYWFRGDLDPSQPHKCEDEHLRAGRVPRRYWDCYLSSIPRSAEHRESLLEIAGSLTNFLDKGSNVVFYGDYGAGKTGGAVSMLREAVKCGSYIWFATAMELPSLFKGFELREHRERVLKQQMLVLDDVGANRDQDFGQSKELVTRVLRTRYDHQVTTLVTTNLTPNELVASLPSMASIFKKDYKHVMCSGVNWRAL